MAHYELHDLRLDVQSSPELADAELAPLLEGLSFVTSTNKPHADSAVRLRARLAGRPIAIPENAREILRRDDFRALQLHADCYLTDGASVFHIQSEQGQAEARLAPSFFDKPLLLRKNFWTFGILKLLQPLGLYPLHAAGLLTPGGHGLLVVARPGSGKSTLAIGMIRHGWRFLSDDALLLRHRPDGVEALALRRHFYVDADDAPRYTDLPLGADVADTSGSLRRRIDMARVLPEQHVARCVPRIVLFPRIVTHTRSELHPMNSVRVLGALLDESGPQLFDKDAMPGHLRVLRTLAQQSVAYELLAGRDLYADPTRLEGLLEEAQGKD